LDPGEVATIRFQADVPVGLLLVCRAVLLLLGLLRRLVMADFRPPPRSGPSAGGGPPAATLSAPRLLRDVGDACHADARQGGPHPPDVVRYASEFVLEAFVPLPSLYEAEAACDIDSVEGHSSEELLCAMASLAPRVARSVLSLLVDGCA